MFAFNLSRFKFYKKLSKIDLYYLVSWNGWEHSPHCCIFNLTKYVNGEIEKSIVYLLAAIKIMLRMKYGSILFLQDNQLKRCPSFK